uniref:Glycine cleavage system H protein n=1 Tax=Wollemia nobilis TaxID=56998 RepID=A0A0C9RGV0_9CONI
MAASKVWASQAASMLRMRMSATMARSSPSFGFPSTFYRGFASVIKDLKYADSHEWVKVDGPLAAVGITDHAQDHLGDVVFVDLPDVGITLSKGGTFGAVESVKATSDVYSPVSGEVVEVNTELNSSPGLVNASPYEDGWIVKVRMSNPTEVDALMSADQYTAFCEKEDASH